MNMENIVKAMQTAAFLRDELRDLHRDTNGAEPFAEIIALEMIGDAARLQAKLNRYAEAARVKGGGQ